MNPMLNVAFEAARRAGQYMLRAQTDISRINIEEKNTNDYVTEVDHKAEAIIIDKLSYYYPDHGFIGEESGEIAGKSSAEWIIDPLDGTTNFIHGVPHFSISIAFRDEGKLQHALVYDPVRDEVFTATRGGGSRLNDRRIRVSQMHELSRAMIGTEFGTKCNQNFEQHLQSLGRAMPLLGTVRRIGSAALDIAYVAAGRFDGFWQPALNIWDMAAGVLLVSEAGGLVCDFDGGHDYLTRGDIVAANPKIAKALLQAIR